MTDNLTKNIESQKSKGDTGSVDSSVKTPLVDALRSYFGSQVIQRVGRMNFEDEVDYVGNLNG